MEPTWKLIETFLWETMPSLSAVETVKLQPKYWLTTIDISSEVHFFVGDATL